MPEETLNYSDDALLNRVLLLNKKRKYTIFVEDCNKEYEYEIIFCRLLNIKLNENILDIFPMNGKPGLIKAYKEYGENHNGSIVVYIADGDFDIMLGKKMVQSSHFLYLDRYNIESYLIDKDAVLTYMMGKLKCISWEASRKIDFDSWEKDTYNKFKELFLLFVVSQQTIPHEETLGKKAYRFLLDDGMVDKEKIAEYRDELNNTIGIDTCKQLYDKFMEKFIKELGGDAKRLICGKFLLASLSYYLRHKLKIHEIKGTFKEDEFQNYLIKTFDINSLKFIKEKMESLI